MAENGEQKLIAVSDRPIWSYSTDSSFLNAVDELISATRDSTPMAAEKPVAASLDRAGPWNRRSNWYEDGGMELEILFTGPKS